MTEPKYDEDNVTLGYLKKLLNNEIVTENSTSISKVYTTQPKPPYTKGDIWIEGNNVYVCVNSRKVGYFSLSDWNTESGAKELAEYKAKTYLTTPSNYRMGDLWILQSDNDHELGKKGEILVANKNAELYDANDWVKEISYVTQEEKQEINEELQTATSNIAKLETNAGLIEARVVQTEVKLDDTYTKEEVEALNEEITNELEIVKKDTGDLKIQSNSISAKVESVETNLNQVANSAITQIKVLYALGDSSTEVPENGWSEIAPTWTDCKYMWQKTATTNGVSTTYSDATCIQGAKGQDGADGKDGAAGENGKSAYEIWLDAGNSGTEEDYLASLKGEQGIQGLQGIQGEKGEQGIPGPKGDTGATGAKGDKGDTGAKGDKGDTGTSGATSYFHIKYSPIENPTASQMTETPNIYIGTYVDFTQEDSTDPNDYTWYKVVGEDGKDGAQGPQGEQGIPGTNGTNGQTSYLHIKYSNDAGQTFTDNSGETVGSYIGQYVDFTAEDSTSVSDYTWAKIEGPQGEKGDVGATGDTGAQGEKGDTGIGVKEIVAQYYLSSSNSTQIDGEWKDTQDSWSEGKFMWTRSMITWTDNTITYTTPILATNTNETNEKIAQLELTDEQIEQTVASNKIASDNDKQELLQKFDNYAPTSEITRVENKVTQLQTDTYTKTQIDTKLVDGSVTKLKSTTLLADDDGLTVDKSDSKTKSNLDADGLTILDKTGSTNDILLRAQYDEEKGETVVETKNLYVQKYLTVAETGRLEKYTRADGKVGVGGFYVGG